MEKKRVLVGSPVHQKPHILREFLGSLDKLEKESIELDFIFVDDNDQAESSRLLNLFKDTHDTVMILEGKKNDTYVCDEQTHHWNESLVWKVAGFKNLIIEKAIELDYDYLFLIDSDILLYPKTVEHLVSTGKEIISEIHWSVWYANWPELPNIWLMDQYNMVPKQRGESLSKEEEDKRYEQFLKQLRIPGIYEVGGLCACTLVGKKALRAGVSFKEVYNVSFWGEDRHFCIRAAALGFQLYVDTHYPGYHIYRESEFAGVENFKKEAYGISLKDTVEQVAEKIKKPLKFAYFSAAPVMKYGLMNGFEKCGYETKLFPLSNNGSPMLTILENGRITYISHKDQLTINSYIDKCIKEYKPDYVVLEGYQEELAVGIIFACEKYGCGFIFWNIEDPIGFDRLLWVAKAADITFTTTIECIERYKENGVNAHLLTFACDPDYHKIGKFNPEYDLDYALQASWYNWQARVAGYNILLKPLLDLGYTYKIWGSNWNTDWYAKNFLGQHMDKYKGILPNSELPDLCASAKVILGFQCDSNSDTQTSMRNYEVLGCGGFYLCQYTKASEKIFQEGQHLELVRNEEEAVEKMKYYLTHDEERKRIALCGQQYVLKEHTYEIRVKENIIPYI